MTRKFALRIAISTLLGLIAWNAYLGVNHLRKNEAMGALIVESSAIQRNISSVLTDLTDMETSQRGYLLTGDTAYLQPYTDAKSRIGTDLIGLRVRLAKLGQHEQSLESQLEALATSKQSEMERGINFRQQGYRHRAFKLVNTNEGKGYMDDIRRIVSSLSAAESGKFARLETERNAALKRTLSITFIANTALFLVAACLLVVIRRHYRLIENEAFQSRRELVSRDLQLEKLTSVLSGQARSDIVAMNTTSRLLLDNYGAFLPRQGHEYAEQMKEAALQMERLRQDLVASVGSDGNEHAA
jgi:CHASE3 domain sensor protein